MGVNKLKIFQSNVVMVLLDQELNKLVQKQSNRDGGVSATFCGWTCTGIRT